MEHKLKQTAWRWLPWLIIAFGFIIRFDLYFFSRSLWLDEAFIAVNFIDKTFWELLQPPLDYSHSILTPPGFLVITKLSITLFGNSDFILRLFPFICGVASLFLFYYMAKAYISAIAVPLALFLFAISDNLIYYSSEFKQYSSDVTITIMLFLLAAYVQTGVLTVKRLLLLVTVGALAVWFSHPAAFILAAIGGYLIILYGFNRQWLSMMSLVGVSLVWLLSFLGMYLLTMEEGVDTSPIGEYLVHLWKSWDSFMPSPFSETGFKWLFNNYLNMFDNPGSLGIARMAGIIFIIGCIAMLIERKNSLFLLTLPIIITLAVSFFQKYPFHGRMILFLLPSLYLIIAEGVVQLQVKLLALPKTAIVTLVTQVILVATLLNYPIYHRRMLQEIKPVLEYVQKNKLNTDILYLYYWTEPAFRYYATDYNFNYGNCHIITPLPKNEWTKEIDYFRNKQGLKPVGVDETQCILGISESFYHTSQHAELDKLRNRGRVWFIFSHLIEHERQLYLNYLDTMGVRIEEFLQPGASVYLYQFGN
jgi:hypothetical protein